MVSLGFSCTVLLSVVCLLGQSVAVPAHREIQNTNAQYENSLSDQDKNLYETRLELLKLLSDMKRNLDFDDSHVLRDSRAPKKRNAGMVDMVLMMPDLFRHGRK